MSWEVRLIAPQADVQEFRSLPAPQVQFRRVAKRPECYTLAAGNELYSCGLIEIDDELDADTVTSVGLRAGKPELEAIFQRDPTAAVQVLWLTGAAPQWPKAVPASASIMDSSALPVARWVRWKR